jgi:hypothetical protein
MERKAFLEIDGDGQMLVFPVDSITFATPVRGLSADVGDQALAKMIPT